MIVSMNVHCSGRVQIRSCKMDNSCLLVRQSIITTRRDTTSLTACP